jgi:uncharacterized protein
MRPRGRPRKYRIVRIGPRISQFSPRGKPGRPDEVNLGIDEYESIRLFDYTGMSQKEAARSMNVSQQTFSRVLKKAHKIVSDAIINGKIIRIQGGNYVISTRKNTQPETVIMPENSPKAAIKGNPNQP